MPTDLLTVKLEKLTYGGDALGKLPDGRAVFVPFALPGETVRVRPVNEKPHHVRARLVEVLEPAPERVMAKCEHFAACGGCHYQHMSYSAQLRAKTGILSDQLKRIGRMADPRVNEIIPSAAEWNYRNHVQFHLARDGRLGYVGVGGRDILPIHVCHLPEPALDAVWPRLSFEPGLGLERISLRVGMDEQVMLVLESDSMDPPGLDLEADLSVVHLVQEDALVLAGDEALVMQVNGRAFQVSAPAFFQVNTAMAGRMVDFLLENLVFAPGATLLDVYSGVGLFSAFFAERCGHLVAIESSAWACQDYAINLAEYDHVDLYQAAAEEVLPALQLTADLAVLDPPRAGLEPDVIQALLAHPPAQIAYVSCDPATLARDAARLVEGGYSLRQVTPFDLFPQTYHIESISIFDLKKA